MILRGLRLCGLLVVLLASSVVAGRRRGSAAAFVVPQVSTGLWKWEDQKQNITAARAWTRLSSRTCMHTHAGHATTSPEWRHVEHRNEKIRVRTARKQQQRQQPHQQQHQQQHQETCRTTTTTTTIPSSSTPPSPSFLLLLPPSFHLRRGRWQDHDLGQETSRFSDNTNSVPRKSAGTTRPYQEGREGWKQRQQ